MHGIQKQELISAQTNGLLDEKSVLDRHRCHKAAKFGVFIDEEHIKLPTLSVILVT